MHNLYQLNQENPNWVTKSVTRWTALQDTIAIDNVVQMIRIKRIYEQPSKEDGYRVLVDRLWPRGMAKDQAKIDLWLREIAPSDNLRKWFGHDPEKWEGFKKKYGVELRKRRELLLEIKQAEKEKGTVTLLYSAKDEEHNQAVALSAILREI